MKKVIRTIFISTLLFFFTTPFIASATCLSLTISSNVNNYNVAIAATTVGWVSPQPICLTINPGVVVGSTSATQPALVTGSIPSGILSITNMGSIIGAGGAGGHGGPLSPFGGTGNGSGGPGGKGGDAISLGASIYLETITPGKVIGGSGGGGGGAGFSCGIGAGWGGGGGAGGAGSTGGIGGAGGQGGVGGIGANGSPGTTSLGGGGGGAGATGPGIGGTNTIGLGLAGADGTSISGPGFCRPLTGGIGGLAGSSIVYNGFTAVPPAGTITVSSNIASSWTITGPATITGSGTSQTSASQPAGTYTITWASIPGYVSPPTTTISATQSLSSGGTITFNGTYTALAPCTLPWGTTMASGAAPVDAYQVSTVVSPALCPAPQQYSCNNGALSGTSYQYQTCTVLPAVVNGVCGSSNFGTFSSAPSTNLCSAGTATAVAGTGPWFWSCNGSNGGTNASCTASTNVIAGALGTANGVPTATAPTSNLCSYTSAPAVVSGTGPWTWVCFGLNGGTNVSGSAPKLASPIKTRYRQF